MLDMKRVRTMQSAMWQEMEWQEPAGARSRAAPRPSERTGVMKVQEEVWEHLQERLTGSFLGSTQHRGQEHGLRPSCPAFILALTWA